MQQRRGVFGDGLRVIAQMRLVGRAHLNQNGPALVDAVREPVRTADLDQLAPRTDDFPARAQAGEHEHRGGGVVVDHQGGLGPRELAEELFRQVVAFPPAAGFEVDLEVAASVQPGERLHRRFRQHGAPQPGVQDDPRAVNHRAGTFTPAVLKTGHDAVGQFRQPR